MCYPRRAYESHCGRARTAPRQPGWQAAGRTQPARASRPGTGRGCGTRMWSRWASRRGFLEPLESTCDPLWCNRASRGCWRCSPSTGFTAGWRSTASTSKACANIVDIRDFLVLHYRATRAARIRNSGAIAATSRSARWTRREARAVPKARAAIIREHNELFTETSWLSVMAGQGVNPRSPIHPVSWMLDEAETRTPARAYPRGRPPAPSSQLPTQDEFLAPASAAPSIRLRANIRRHERTGPGGGTSRYHRAAGSIADDSYSRARSAGIRPVVLRASGRRLARRSLPRSKATMRSSPT
jgi:hypothetical protein